MKKEKGLERIKERIADFKRNEPIIMQKGYGETNIRTNYIDVMFESLGWNIRNKSEVDREFSQRDKSKEANTKKVDYAFKLNGKLKFFVEAKEASVDLEHNKDAIYQAKRYAYSSNGKAPIVILTDFEEFRVFNVLTAPIYDNPDKQLLKSHSFRYTDYVEKWDLLWDTFSKEAVEKGSLDDLCGKITKNTKTMDKDFLEQITKWRENLARNIANRNAELSVDDINEAVQRILDRLIFLRNLEDRGIEPENTLLKIAKDKDDILKSLTPLFNRLNIKYNGLLFKPHFSEEISVDNTTLYEIIREMCYPVSPFQFDIIEPEILGRIYEKFLGSKIRLTDSHRAKVEEKLEVRKAGGVYYTPEYIVEYIVKNTVGKKIEGLTPDEIKDIKIVDPACGSGSFLLGAYSYLLEYHRKWYSENKRKTKYKSDWYETKDKEIVVNLHKRGDILVNNIFGVDIDKEATEVAIMSLYLKMLDDGFDKGESELFFIKGSVLPAMTDNVKCGNSLINEDIVDENMLFNCDNSEMKTINPFNWQNNFADVFSDGGFNCVIGNPPWVFTKYFDWGEKSKKYIEKIYLNTGNSTNEGRSRQSGKINLFAIFILKSIKLLKDKGVFSLIVPNTILRTTTYDIIRKEILESVKIYEIVDLKENVFDGVTASTIILTLIKDKNKINNNIVKIVDQPLGDTIIRLPSVKVYQKNFNSNTSYSFDIYVNNKENIILNKFFENSILLEDIVNIFNGIATGPNKLGLHDKCINEKCKKILIGRDIKDYFHEWSNHWIEYDSKLLHRARNEEIFLSDEKLIMQRIGGILVTSYDNERYYTFNSINNLLLKNNDYSLKYILGCLNSKALRYFYIKKYTNKSNLTVNIPKTYLNKLPIPKICCVNEKIIDEIVKAVDSLLILNKSIKKIKSERENEIISSKKHLIIENINRNIYSLYGLSEEQINTIENR